jgi:hypothetical protein
MSVAPTTAVTDEAANDTHQHSPVLRMIEPSSAGHIQKLIVFATVDQQ